VFLALASLSFVAYRNCFELFIPGDSYSFFAPFENSDSSTLFDAIKRDAPYLVGYSLLYFLFKLFGFNSAYWVMTAIILHALNAFLVYIISKKIIKLFLKKDDVWPSILVAAIFLLSPYQTENVLWTAINIKWLFHAIVTLSTINICIDYFIKDSFKKLLLIQFLFLLGLYSFEFTFVLPLLLFAFYLAFRKINLTTITYKSFLLRLVLPQAFMLVSYFIVSKLIYNTWIWHAGTPADFLQTSDYAKTLLKYFAKFFLLYRYLPIGEFGNALKSISENSSLMLLILLIFLSVLGFSIWKLFIKHKALGIISSALFLCFIISLLPVLPLDSSFLSYIYPDRYGYIPSVFFYLFVSITISQVLPKVVVALLSAYAILCVVLLSQTTSVWIQVNTYCNQLVESHKPFAEYEHAYLLNVPAYYKGVAAFRSAYESTVEIKNSTPPEKINVIAGCYQDSGSDSIASVEFNYKRITVIGPKRETPYFSTAGGWAKNYENDDFRVVFDASGCSYTIFFKQEIPKNSVFLYNSKGAWKKAG